MGFHVRAMFNESHLSLPELQNILYHFFAWTSFHLTCLPILEGAIISITNYDHDENFSIYVGGKLVG